MRSWWRLWNERIERLVRRGPLAPTVWVEPSNDVTRAIYGPIERSLRPPLEPPVPTTNTDVTETAAVVEERLERTPTAAAEAELAMEQKDVREKPVASEHDAEEPREPLSPERAA